VRTLAEPAEPGCEGNSVPSHAGEFGYKGI
jgi:hypothetical protein